MKKTLKVLLLGLLAVCFALPLASSVTEAAKVAVMPLVMHLNSLDDKEYSENCPMVYSNVCVKYFTYPAFDMVDTDLVRQAMAMHTDPYTKDAMVAIANATGADIVFGMTLERFTVEERRVRREETMYVNYSGRQVFYNKLTGRYQNSSWQHDDEMEMGFLVRSNYPYDQFAKAMEFAIPGGVKKLSKF